LIHKHKPVVLVRSRGYARRTMNSKNNMCHWVVVTTANRKQFRINVVTRLPVTRVFHRIQKPQRVHRPAPIRGRARLLPDLSIRPTIRRGPPPDSALVPLRFVLPKASPALAWRVPTRYSTSRQNKPGPPPAYTYHSTWLPACPRPRRL